MMGLVIFLNVINDGFATTNNYGQFSVGTLSGPSSYMWPFHMYFQVIGKRLAFRQKEQHYQTLLLTRQARFHQIRDDITQSSKNIVFVFEIRFKPI